MRRILRIVELSVCLAAVGLCRPAIALGAGSHEGEGDRGRGGDQGGRGEGRGEGGGQGGGQGGGGSHGRHAIPELDPAAVGAVAVVVAAGGVVLARRRKR